METITGSVEEIIFQNEENGYSVCDVDAEGTLITVVGCMPYLSPGETITVTGEYKMHPLYGRQFSVSTFTKTPPNSVDAIYKYLASGLIKGVREASAKKIVEAFGADALNVIENSPEKLAEIKGISLKKAYEIGNEYIMQFGVRNIVMFLQENNVSPLFAAKILKRFGSGAVDKIKANPYLLAQEIYGIGFKTADKIAMKQGIDPNDMERIKAAVKYVLQENAGSGNTYLPMNTLLSKTAYLIGADPDIISNAITSLALEKAIVIEHYENHDGVYLIPFHLAEVNGAFRLKQLNELYPEKQTPELDKLVKTVEQKTGIQLETKQRQAVMTALTFPVVVITGGPGTGKTTVINTIIRAMEMQGKTVLLTAPTGRAAKRMSEVTNRDAKTIHRLLETGFSDEEGQTKFMRNETNPLEAHAVIVDEMSMVDILLFNSILRALTPGTKLILVGDADQLPSVGPGNVLRDIIASDGVAVVKLTEIFRQAQESMIVVNAHRINQGAMPYLNVKGKDFFFLPRNTPEQIITTIRDLCVKRLPKSYGYNPFTDIQVLTPMRKNAVGVNTLNKALQEALNPPAPEKKEKLFGDILFRTGDKIMQVKNNYDIEWERTGALLEQGTGLFNGDMGIIEDLDNEFEEFHLLFDEDKKVVCDYSSVNELEMAYATTIHKSQGSEFPVVVLPLFPGSPMLLSRNLLYTAITRAKNLVVLVGQEQVLRQMVDNNSEVRRYSGFAERLRY